MLYWVASMVYQYETMVHQYKTMLNCNASRAFQNKTIKARLVKMDDAFKATIYISSKKIVGGYKIILTI